MATQNTKESQFAKNAKAIVNSSKKPNNYSDFVLFFFAHSSYILMSSSTSFPSSE